MTSAPSSPRTARGRLVVLSGPSGSGKTTVARALLEDPGFARARTATTRPPRGDERPGEAYDFLTEDEFEAGVRAGRFLEHARVYGHRYGTPRQNLEPILASGRNGLLVVDVQGARTLKDLGVDATYVFVTAPDPEEMLRRLTARGEDDEAAVRRRVAEAEREAEAASWFDLVVVNDDLDAAVRRLVAGAGLAWSPGRGEE